MVRSGVRILALLSLAASAHAGYIASPDTYPNLICLPALTDDTPPPILPDAGMVAAKQTPTSAPEPSTIALAGVGLILLGAIRRRK
jgi:PEP-CTERM motif